MHQKVALGCIASQQGRGLERWRVNTAPLTVHLVCVSVSIHLRETLITTLVAL